MFKITAIDSKTRARTGRLYTAHGAIETPFLMPVATKGSVKYASSSELREMGYRAFISNAFLLSLRPGPEIIAKAGGLHKFIGWDKVIFTDSGGFQLLSEDFLIKASDSGVWLRNPFDKSKTFFMPEQSIKAQNALGSDAAMCLDDVPCYGKGKDFYAVSLKRTLEWAERCKKAHKNSKQLLFAISQGGTFKDLREKGLLKLNKLGFDGIALGGLCIGERQEVMHHTVSHCKKFIPEEQPTYLMGVGSPAELLHSISQGIDAFDSCFPTRVARHGTAITSRGSISPEKGKYSTDFSPLDENCGCFVCRQYSRAFLHHLVKTKEENGARYLTYHNLWFMQHLINEVHTAIREHRFSEFMREKLQLLGSANPK